MTPPASIAVMASMSVPGRVRSGSSMTSGTSNARPLALNGCARQCSIVLAKAANKFGSFHLNVHLFQIFFNVEHWRQMPNLYKPNA